GFHGDVEFRFDEVISEGSTASTGTGTGDLEKLILLSPTTRVPDVNWRRSRITVRPAEGWRADRVYRVELLPGVTDLRRNRSEEGKVVTFSTGGPPRRWWWHSCCPTACRTARWPTPRDTSPSARCPRATTWSMASWIRTR